LGVRVAPGALEKSYAVAGDFMCLVIVEGLLKGDLWEPFTRSDVVGRSPWQLTRTYVLRSRAVLGMIDMARE